VCGFASPRCAVDAAVAAQLALGLPVRMGMATGEAELRGADYFGAVLNRAARVMSAGHGGQILLDGVTAGLLNDIDLVDLGPRRLRDLAKPVELFQVGAPTTYHDPGDDYFTRLNPQRARTNAVRQLEAMGYHVTLDQAS
jgi:class 3 adenylate cyclase